MGKTAFIPAAGLGTRLKPLTDNRPKALVELSGKPLLWHTIMKLKGFGYTRFVVNVHHFGEMIIDYCACETDFQGLEILISDERDLLMDTGGGIFKAEKYLNGCGEFLVHNVDIYTTDFDFSDIRLPEGYLASLLMSRRSSTRGLHYDSNKHLTGWQNFVTGDTKGIITSDYAAFNGISIVSDKVFGVMKEYLAEHYGDASPRPFSVIDFYLSVCSAERIKCDVRDGISITDIGKIDTLRSLEK